MAVAEGAAKAAFGTRFKRVPRSSLRQSSLPVLSVLAVFAFVFCVAAERRARWNVPWNVRAEDTEDKAFSLCRSGASRRTVRADRHDVPRAGHVPVPACTATRAASRLATRPTPSRRRRARAGGAQAQGRLALLQEVRARRNPARAPLPPVQPLRFTHGPPLRLGEHQGRAQELQVFLSVSVYAVVSIWHAALLLASRRVRGGAHRRRARPAKRVAIPRREDVSLGVAEVAALTLAVPLALALTMLFGVALLPGQPQQNHHRALRGRARGGGRGEGGGNACRRCTPHGRRAEAARTRWGFAPT